MSKTTKFYGYGASLSAASGTSADIGTLTDKQLASTGCLLLICSDSAPLESNYGLIL